jgi:hypothetical protein
VNSEKFVFGLVTLGMGFAIITYLRGLPARLAIAALALGVMLFGPQVLGRDWYFDGFIAGFFMGDFYGTAATQEQSDAERLKEK